MFCPLGEPEAVSIHRQSRWLYGCWPLKRACARALHAGRYQSPRARQKPVAPRLQNPIAPRQQNPIAPRQQNPIAPRQQKPAAPRRQKPVAPRQQNPIAPRQQNPIRPAPEAQRLFTLVQNSF